MKPRNQQFCELIEKTFGAKHVPASAISDVLTPSLANINVSSTLLALFNRGIIERGNHNGVITHKLVPNWRDIKATRKRADISGGQPKRKQKTRVGDLRIKDIERMAEENKIFSDALQAIASIVINVMKK